MVVVDDPDQQTSRSATPPAAATTVPQDSPASSGRPRNQGFFLRLRPDDDEDVPAADTANRQDSDEDDEEVDGDAGTSTWGSKPVQDKELEPDAEAEDDPAAGNFDCNICLDLAQDPVVTLCGHLFCWPCLYKWLQLRPIQKECPVCKAPVHEEKVIPLYGRGSVDSADPRSSDVSEMAIPSRPQGHRTDPQTPLAWHARRFYDPYGFSFVAGAAGPAASARFGNVTFSAGFGLFPSLFRLQFHGFPDSTGVAGPMMPYGSFPAATSHHHHHHHLGPLPPLRSDQQERLLSRLLLFVGGVMILCFLYF